jgi:hypothetical protein
MTVMAAVLIGLAMGIVFGFALEKSRVFEPGMIVGQMQLRNFIMLKVFLTAVATGAVVLAVLNGFGWVKLHPKGALFVADILGGLVMGAGIALAGACPGTVLAQVGAGYRDALITVVGGLAGAMTFSYLEPTFAPTLAAGDLGRITFADVTGIPYWGLALALAAVLVGVLSWLESWRPWRDEMGTDVNGDFGAGGEHPSAVLQPADKPGT